jgi:hypothetical protein
LDAFPDVEKVLGVVTIEQIFDYVCNIGEPRSICKSSTAGLRLS